MILLANGKVITRDPNGTGYYPDGGVVTDGGKIVAVGPTAELKAKYPAAEFVDARGGVIMPGLINAHTHIYSALARGLSINGYNPTNFYEVLDGQWWYIDRNLDLEATRASAQALVIDSIKQGVTTIFDHHASFCEIPGSLMKIAEVTKEFGMRACLCYEVSDRDGEEKSLQSVQENKDFIDYCEKNPDSMLKAMFGGHALFTISDKTFDRMVAANNGRVGYHIHVSEGMNDVYDSLQNYGRRPVQRLQDHGILGPKTILGHCIHVNTAEMDIIQATDTMCVNNPESNMGNAVGCSPILQLYKKGILVGLGHRRLHQRHAGEHQGGPDHPAAQRLYAQCGLVRGDGHALQEQRQDGRAHRLPHPGHPGPRRRRRRDRHGLQALHPLLRRQHRRPHALRHDRPPVPDHHDQRQDSDE